MPTVGSWGEAFFYGRGTPAEKMNLYSLSCVTLRAFDLGRRAALLYQGDVTRVEAYTREDTKGATLGKSFS